MSVHLTVPTSLATAIPASWVPVTLPATGSPGSAGKRDETADAERGSQLTSNVA